MEQADIGLIGLAVMGQNLVLNMNDHGYQVAVFNRTASKTDEFLNGPAKGTKVIGFHTLKDFIQNLKRPRKVMLMVKAGDPVDEFIDLCLPFLEKGDLIIDGGNSLFTDTNRRTESLKKKGILFIGTGISGGEEGARHGPSIMPGGNPDGWPLVKKIFQDISAKVENGEPCCEWVGDNGAGHYVKMVHNGIEYGDMQLISESYALLSKALKATPKELQETFAKWNKGKLNSYLIEITSQIFTVNDSDGTLLLDKILDTAGQKGTGKWTVINALDLGMPLTLISEAVFARCLSALKEERIEASKKLKGPKITFDGNKENFSKSIGEALYASKIISYAQGFMLMQQAAKEFSWKLNYGSIALMWRGGCIIRSLFLGKIKEAFEKNPNLKNLLLDDFFAGEINEAENGWREVIAAGVKIGIPLPCFSTALSFYDGYRSEKLPANLLQGMRDFFGAHTYERTDRPRGEFFHTNWTGTGGNVSSTSYNA
ncbi:MAG TPA: decarboxylating NADP(+)-dependent phosphogluconate dehydrogenase [Parachlamydiaceae bacterium]|nr:decarboxylating NADP(+)-dependent phosphogluconate dehydrogenase [Parachlamydiaceae bacterium]